MADLRYWYTGQLVTAQEMRGGDAELEQGIFDLATDMGFVGVIDGGEVAEHAGTPNLTVDVAALLARSPLGERIRVAGTPNVDCEFDYLTQPTAVTTPGNFRLVDIYVVFDRLGSDPRLDATNTTVYFVQEESFAFEVHQGAEASSPSAPAGPSDGVRLARITLAFGQTTIETVDIDTTAKESVVKLSSGSIAIEAGTFTGALQLVIDELAGHIDGSGSHPATAILYGGGANWADGTTNPNTTVELQLDKIVSNLILTTSGASGAHKIGCANSSAWADGTSITGTTIYAFMNTIITTLAASTGATKIGIGARTNWLGGRTNPAITASGGVFAAIDKIITDLAATTTNDDGMERVGGQAVSGSPYSLTAGSSRSQADELLGYSNTNRTKLNALIYVHPTPSTSTAPTYTNSTNTFTEITSLLFGAPVAEQVAANDVVEISFTCSASASVVHGQIALFVQEGAGASTAITGARVRARVGDDASICLVARHKVSSAGALIVSVKGRASTGAGTITVVEAYRLEAKRLRPAT